MTLSTSTTVQSARQTVWPRAAAAIVLGLAVLIGGGCGSEDTVSTPPAVSPTPAPTPTLGPSAPVTLQFRGMVGDQPFACGNIYHNIGTTNGDIVPSDFRLYIHDVRLVYTGGGETPLALDQDGIWQYANVVMLDFENKVQPCNEEGTTLTNSTVHGMAAAAPYTGVRFLLGVPSDLDHANAAIAPSPLNLTAMFWSWQDGYKFLRIDTAFDNLRVHLGSIGCSPGPGGVTTCVRPNVGAVNLDHFDPATNVIAVDIAALLADSDINANQVNTAPGCQSEAQDLDCVPIFKNLGVNFSDGSPNPTSQKFFRVE